MKASYKDGRHVMHKADTLEAQARQEMKKKAGSWPIQMPGQSTQDYYDEVVRYGSQESAIIAEELNKPVGGERPLELDNTKSRRENWYDR